MHRAAVPMAAPLLLAVHLRHDRARRHAAHQRMTMLAISGKDRIVARELGHHPARDRLLADIQMQEAADLAGAVNLRAFFLETADARHLAQVGKRAFTVNVHADSSVEISPSGRPISRALSRRRMILPLRVLGRPGKKAISFGATAVPRRLRTKASSSRRSASSAT